LDEIDRYDKEQTNNLIWDISLRPPSDRKYLPCRYFPLFRDNSFTKGIIWKGICKISECEYYIEPHHECIVELEENVGFSTEEDYRRFREEIRRKYLKSHDDDSWADKW